MIFISYRRTDMPNVAEQLAIDLRRAFGGSSVFLDASSVETGDLWEAKILNALADACVVLVVVGPSWSCSDSESAPDSPEDWVRREVRQALQYDKNIFPILVGGAKLPERDALPPDIRPLVDRQAFELREGYWKVDRDRLIVDIRRRVAGSPAYAKRFFKPALALAALTLCLASFYVVASISRKTNSETPGASPHRPGTVDVSIAPGVTSSPPALRSSTQAASRENTSSGDNDSAAGAQQGEVHRSLSDMLTIGMLSVTPTSHFIPHDRYARFHPERVDKLCSFSTVPNADSVIYAKGVDIVVSLTHSGTVPISVIVKRITAKLDKYQPIRDVSYTYPPPSCVSPLLFEPTRVLIILTSVGHNGTVWVPRDREIKDSHGGYKMPRDHWEWFPWYKEGMTAQDVMFQRLDEGSKMVIAGDNALSDRMMIKLVPNSKDDTEVLDMAIIGAEEGYYEFHLEVGYSVGATSSTLETSTYRVLHDPRI